MNKVLPQLLRRYDIQLVNPGKPLDHHSSFFVVQWGLKVYMRVRGARRESLVEAGVGSIDGRSS